MVISSSSLNMQAISFLLACILSAGVSGEIYFKDGSPHVKLNDNAVVSGSVEYSREGRPFSSFLGLPYATISERFNPSEISHPSWDGVKPFTKPGPLCMQRYFDGDSLGVEECLTVNIYVPMNNTGDRRGYPTMVWIHGGGFMLGGSQGYGPKFFMDEDVLLISFNYRLGVFGFLSTGDTVVPGNNGLKDMVTLLKWVQENVAKFGGNPDKVTIFGESAGSASVDYLRLSPLTEGLFHRAIGQSGSSLVISDPDPKGTAIELATHLKCATTASNPSEITSQEILACFKTVSGDKLNKAQFEFRQSYPSNIRSFFFVPTPEAPETPDALITEYPMNILVDKSRQLREVPLMMGATEDEGSTMYAGVIAEHPKLLEELNADWYKFAPLYFDYARYPIKPDQLKEISRKIKEFYFGSVTEPISLEKHRKNLTNLYSDELITYSVHKMAMETAARGNKKAPVYLYQYAHPGPVSIMGSIFQLKGEETKRVCHADELQHLFDLAEDLFPGASQGIKRNSAAEEFSKNLVRLWVSFAIHGEPKYFWGSQTKSELFEKMKWRPLSKKAVDGEFAVKWWRLDTEPGYVTEPYKERMQFWDRIYKDYFIPFYTKSASSESHSKIEL